MTKDSNVMKKHPLMAYFFQTFIISWAAVFILAGSGGFPVSQEQAASLGVAILLGPSIAGLIMTGLIYGRSGYSALKSRLIKWRTGIQWYAFALLTAPLFNPGGIIASILFFITIQPHYIYFS